MRHDIRSLIIYEDPHIIVCRKPAGVPTQSARISTPDMASMLKNYLSGGYLAVIHRLDQPVEGLLVFAKTPGAARELNRQLTSSGFGKYYRAIVSGIPEPTEGTLEDYMVKDARANASRICTKNTPGAKAARLHYRVEKIFRDTSPVTSLVAIHLDTGRHHQIRVQMAHIGCPLVGDRKYGTAYSSPAHTASGENISQAHVGNTGPLRLCACRLEFRHPVSREQKTFLLPENSW